MSTVLQILFLRLFELAFGYECCPHLRAEGQCFSKNRRLLLLFLLLERTVVLQCAYLELCIQVGLIFKDNLDLLWDVNLPVKEVHSDQLWIDDLLFLFQLADG